MKTQGRSEHVSAGFQGRWVLPEQPLCPVMLIDRLRKQVVQALCNPQG